MKVTDIKFAAYLQPCMFVRTKGHYTARRVGRWVCAICISEVESTLQINLGRRNRSRCRARAPISQSYHYVNSTLRQCSLPYGPNAAGDGPRSPAAHFNGRWQVKRATAHHIDLTFICVLLCVWRRQRERDIPPKHSVSYTFLTFTFNREHWRRGEM